MFLNQEKNNLGYWSPATSIIDWCEPNYQHFDTVAETYNTFSSLAYVFAEIWFVYTLERFFNSHKLAGNLRMLRTYVLIVSALIVGVGTYLFHMTLLREHQMLDELSMNATILLHIYGMINMDEDDKVEDGKKIFRCFGLFNTTKAALTALCCVSLFSISCAVYDTMIPVVFQTLFGLSILTGVILSVMQALKKYDNISLEYKKHFETARRHKIALICGVVGSAVIGFTLWLIDNNNCPKYEHLKLHALWHCFTAYAGFLWGIFAIHTHATNQFAKNLASGEPAAMTKVCWGLFPSVAFVKAIEKSKLT